MNETGTVYWLTGLSGAGKTTIGRLWYAELKQHKSNIVFLDGDTLREVFGDDLGYTTSDRQKSAMRNARLCRMLSEQSLDVVCCTISMFDTVRDWNRANIPNYREIYVKVSMDTLKQRDQKGLYSTATDNVAGLHFHVEEPKTPDLILQNNGKKTPEQQIEQLKEKFL